MKGKTGWKRKSKSSNSHSVSETMQKPNEEQSTNKEQKFLGMSNEEHSNSTDEATSLMLI